MAAFHKSHPFDEEQPNPSSDVKRKEGAAPGAGILLEDRNWPPFLPIIHHDITNDIPIHLKKTQKFAFATFLGVFVCLLWNIVAVTMAWIKGQGWQIWVLAVVYFILGVLGAYFLWYRPLYRALRTENAMKLRWFFLFYLIHILIFLYAAASPPVIYHGKSISGFMGGIWVAVDSYSILPFIFYMIGFGLFCIEAFISLWVLLKAYLYYRRSRRAGELKPVAAGGERRAAI